MARARRRHRPAEPAPAAVPVLDDLDVPSELADPDAAVWQDQRAYRAFMARHGWTLPPAERMGVATSSANRRAGAAAGWAQQHDIAAIYGDPQNRPHPDWHQLREWGLIA